MITKIEVDFAIPVELSDDDIQKLDALIQGIAKRHEPKGMLHWCAGMGNKPVFSQADSRFLGKPVNPDAPISGEPTWNDSIFYIETCCRERYPDEV